ncbi:unnamed protein product, partial [Ilex paraguariensis]
ILRLDLRCWIFKVESQYKYGPCAPIGHAKEIPSSEQVLLHDEARIKFMNDRISNLYPTEESNSPLPISTDSKEAGIYTVTIKMGTPQQDYSVSIDTGSDITWLQCQPCSKAAILILNSALIPPSPLLM